MNLVISDSFHFIQYLYQQFYLLNILQQMCILLVYLTIPILHLTRLKVQLTNNYDICQFTQFEYLALDDSSSEVIFAIVSSIGAAIVLAVIIIMLSICIVYRKHHAKGILILTHSLVMSHFYTFELCSFIWTI